MSGVVFWWYSTENLSPRITPAFLERQRRLLLPGQYAREHQNQWVEAADAFTSAADVDAAMGHGWTEQLIGQPGVRHEHFWDLGTVHDPTVGVVGHTDGDRVYIDRLVTYQGSRDAPVQMATVEAAVLIREPLWLAVQRRLESMRKFYLRTTSGTLHGRARGASGHESKYLLTGLAECGSCHGGLTVHSRVAGDRRTFAYLCGGYIIARARPSAATAVCSG